MKNIQENLPFFRQLLDMLERQFGPNCEIVLHDLTQEYANTIVDIRNGHVTGRRVGDCGGNWGLEVLRGTIRDGDRHNYIIHGKEGNIVRSSSIFIKDEDGKIIGSLCINQDITETVRFEEYLHRYNHHGPVASQAHELFVNDVGQLLDNYFLQCRRMLGKDGAEMSKAEKLEVVRFLDRRGAFLITRSGDRTCEFLNISKFTLYNYLDAVRTEEASGGDREGEEGPSGGMGPEGE